MKPSWDDAPAWANFLAMDDDCYWYWYENMPTAGISSFLNKGGRADLASEVHDWKESLEPRP